MLGPWTMLGEMLGEMWWCSGSKPPVPRAPADTLPDRSLPPRSVSQPLPRFKRGTRDPM
jgi:hypothetical protein